MEGVATGLPMVTWPRYAEQLYIEKLVTHVLRIGVPVGVKGWVARLDKNENIVRAMKKIMIGKEAEDMKNRAKHLQEMARRSIEDGGSSYSDLNVLIEELKTCKK